jgi:GTP-binding nuclear protein Ran
MINVLLVGPANSGKTVYVKRVNTGEFDKNYDTTKIPEMSIIKFLSNKGYIEFTIHDFSCNIDIKKEILNLKKNKSIDAIITMFELSNISSFHESLKIIKNIKQTLDEQEYNKIPKVLVGNKYDVRPKRVNQQMVSEYMTNKEVYGNFQYYPVSARSCFNFEIPFLYISKKLIGHDLTFEEDLVDFDDDKFDYLDNDYE